MKKVLALILCALLAVSCAANTLTICPPDDDNPGTNSTVVPNSDGDSGNAYDESKYDSKGLEITEIAGGGSDTIGADGAASYDYGAVAELGAPGAAEYTDSTYGDTPAYPDSGIGDQPVVSAGTLTAGVINDRSFEDNYTKYLLDNASNYWILNLEKANPKYTVKALDLMFYFDTTGSMGDELTYIQAEATDIINRVWAENGSIPIRISVCFYRDEGDEYIVRATEFSADVAAAIAFLNEQSANGGGDTPEAVHTAMQNAADHAWSEDNVVKLCFWFYDAPPHEGTVKATGQSETDVKQTIINSANTLISKQVKFFPIASSHSDMDVEVLSRQLAYATGGQYIFLTDSSGVSVGTHIEPSDLQYNEKPLNDLIVELINAELAAVNN